MKKKIFSLFLIPILFISTSHAQLGYEWVNIFNGSGNFLDYASDLKIDQNGNVYVLAKSFESSVLNYNTVLLKYNASGQLQWEQSFSDSASLDENPASLELGTNSEVFVIGERHDEIFILKYDDDGNLLWKREYVHDLGSNYYYIYSQITSDGDLIVAATEEKFFNPNNVIVFKYDSNGNLNWDFILPNSFGSYDFVFAMYVDHEENVYFTGVTNYFTNLQYLYHYGGDAMVVKLFPSGLFAWKKSFDAPDSSYDQGTCIVTDEFDNCYISGFSEKIGGSASKRLLVMKLDPNGALIWIDSVVNATQDQWSGANTLHLLNNKLYLAGTKYDSIYHRILNLCYDAEGNQLWQHDYNSVFGYDQQYLNYSIISQSKTILTLNAEHNSGSSDRYPTLIELDTSGNFVKAWQLDSTTNSLPVFGKIQQALSGEFLLLGQQWNSYSGNSDVVTARIGNITGINHSIPPNNYFGLFPNPSSFEIFLSTNLSSYNNTEAVISDLAGRELIASQVLKPIQRFDISFLSQGIYVLQFKTPTEIISKYFFVTR